MTARKLVRPGEFLDTLFWGRETTAALILERGLRVQTQRAADLTGHWTDPVSPDPAHG